MVKEKKPVNKYLFSYEGRKFPTVRNHHLIGKTQKQLELHTHPTKATTFRSRLDSAFANKVCN
jgi:hypothetical protein